MNNMKKVNFLFKYFVFLFLLISCDSNGELPKDDDYDYNSRIIFEDEYITVKRNWDEESATYYFLSRIKHKDKDGKLLELKLDTSIYDMGEAVVDFANRKGKPIIAINASTGVILGDNEYRKSPGILILNGQVIKQETPSNYTFGIKVNNELVTYPKGTTPQAMVADGVIKGFSVFTPFVLDYEPVSAGVYSMVPNQLEKNPRQVIAQFENNDILVFSCGGRGYDGAGMKAVDVIRILMGLEDKIRFAHNLDGGGSVTTVIYGNQITKKIDGNGTLNRIRPTFLYIEKN